MGLFGSAPVTLLMQVRGAQGRLMSLGMGGWIWTKCQRPAPPASLGWSNLPPTSQQSAFLHPPHPSPHAEQTQPGQTYQVWTAQGLDPAKLSQSMFVHWVSLLQRRYQYALWHISDTPGLAQEPCASLSTTLDSAPNSQESGLVPGNKPAASAVPGAEA